MTKSIGYGLKAAAFTLALVATPALAAEGQGGGGGSEALFVAQIVVLVVAGRLLGEAMQRIGQPAVIGQLLAGVLLGPSVFGALWPAAQHAIFPSAPGQKAMLDAVAQLGVLMLLLLTGMETDIGFVARVKRAAASVSLTGIAIPFACGVALGEFLPDALLPDPGKRLVTSLFLGTALSISSVKIVAMVVREMNFSRRNIGQIILASAIIDDTIGWLVIALTFSIALHGSLDLVSFGKSLAGTLLFLGLSFTVGRRLVFLAIRWTNDTFVSEMAVLSTILAIMGAMALVTDAIGVHTVLGAFVAGMLVGQSPILTRHIEGNLRGLISALFMPVFFGTAGLSADLTILKDPRLALLTAGLVAIASVGKFLGAFSGGFIGGLTRAESVALGCGMNARGSTEVVVASIGLSIGVVSRDLYTMIVAMAVLTTLAMPPMLRWALNRLPMGEDERRRLEREETESRGFLSQVERLLVAVDGSAKGQFASRLVGLVAGLRGLPVTVMHVGEAETTAPEIVKTAALREGAVATIADEDLPDEVDVVTRPANAVAPPVEQVSEEARKGYDLMVIGIRPTVAPEGGLDPEVVRLAAGFDGPLVIATARGVHEERPLEAPIDILVPVTGTQVSRRGAELAISIARASGARVMALYVASRREQEAARGDARGRGGGPVLREIVELGEQAGVPVRTAVRVDVGAEDAILRQARLGRQNLIVMGVARRTAETLAFDHVATALLEASDRSLVFVTD